MGHHFRTRSTLTMTSEGIVSGTLLRCAQLEVYAMAPQGAKSSGCETTHLLVERPNLFQSCQKFVANLSNGSCVCFLWMLRDSGPLTTVGCTRFILGDRASVTHSPTCTRPTRELLEKDEVCRVELDLRDSRRSDEVVAE